MPRIPHPIPYQGSKRRLAETILAYAPPVAERMVEPFAGSAALSLAAASRKVTDRFWLNDAHGALMSLWKEIVTQPNRLADGYQKLWQAQLGQEREYFNQVRAEFNQTRTPAHFLYLLARCVKAAVRYNSSGEFNNTPDNRRKGTRPDAMRDHIRGAAALLGKNAQVTSLDYRDVLSACTAEDLIYLDPPYQGVGSTKDTRYAPKVCHLEFSQALAGLNARNCMYIVSYDGRTGSKTFGPPLDRKLGLVHLEICAGRSSQATLLGRSDLTYESVYLSPALLARTTNDGHPVRANRTLKDLAKSASNCQPVRTKATS